MKILDQIETKYTEWASLQPMKSADEKRFWEKLRLEWNFHSNHIEGNTLTYGETELLFLHGQAVGDHDYRDYLEMKAHDLAIEHLRKLVAEERPIGEADIRDLNQILLKEPFFKPAITTDGKETRNEIVPGKYKTQPNNVLTKEGIVFEFATPDEVPIRMQALVERLHEEIKNPSVSAISFAAWLHHEFVMIHPFSDGNGRTARLLVNYLLMRQGYPPLIVETENKDRYFAALRRADGGDLESLIEFFAQCALKALDRGIRAAKSESIEEEDDLTKEIEIFKRQHSGETKELLSKSPETLQKIFYESLKPLFEEYISENECLNDLFHQTKIHLGNDTSGRAILDGKFEWEFMEHYMDHVKVSLIYKGFNGNAASPFNMETFLHAEFREYEWSVDIDNQDTQTFLYGDPIPPSVRRAIVKQGLKRVFAQIKKNSNT